MSLSQSLLLQMITRPPLSMTSPIALSPLSVASKAKLLLHGGAVTEEELESISTSDDRLDLEQFRGVMQAWRSTPEYEIKIKQFIKLALQQDMVNRDDRYIGQLDDLAGGSSREVRSFRENMEDMFVQTAWQIVKNDRDFRQVIYDA